MFKKSSSLLIIFAVLISVYGVSKFFIDKKKNAVSAIIDSNLSKMLSIRINNGKKETIVKKDGETWIFSAPYAGKTANKEDIEKFHNIFKKLSVIKDLGSIEISSAAPFGITEKSPSLTFEFEKKSETLYLGMNSPVAQQSYIYRKDTKKLSLVNSLVTIIFSVKPEDFRGSRLFTFKAEDIESLLVKPRLGSDILFKKEGKDWYVTKDSKEYLCNNLLLKALTVNITRLEIADFEPSDKQMTPAQCGLLQPSFSFTISLSSGIVKTLAIGRSYGNGLAYASTEKGLVGGTNSAFTKDLLLPVTSYAVNKIIDFPLAAVASINVKNIDDEFVCTKRRGKWYKTVKKERPMDEEKVFKFFNVLDNLGVQKYYFDNKVGEVKREFLFYNSKNELLVSIQIGDQDGENTKLKFKDKRGVFGVSTQMVELLEL